MLWISPQAPLVYIISLFLKVFKLLLSGGSVPSSLKYLQVSTVCHLKQLLFRSPSNHEETLEEMQPEQSETDLGSNLGSNTWF